MHIDPAVKVYNDNHYEKDCFSSPQYPVGVTILSGRHSTPWTSQYSVDVTVLSGRHSTQWRSQYSVDVTVLGGRHSTQWTRGIGRQDIPR